MIPVQLFGGPRDGAIETIAEDGCAVFVTWVVGSGPVPYFRTGDRDREGRRIYRYADWPAVPAHVNCGCQL